MPWVNRFFGGKIKSGRKAPRRPIVLRLEHFEDRLAPIVGAFALPTAIAPLAPPQPQLPSPYDGVVLTRTALGKEGSGSLIKTETGWGFGHQILTIAHGIAQGPKADPGGSAITVRFDLARGGNPVPITINVPKNVIGGAQYQVQHSAFAGFLNDIGLLVLTDQVNSAPDRLLVAPYTAQQYTLYNGNPAEVSQQFTMVGYGDTGTGATGSNQAGGTKRAGQNRFDFAGVPWDPARTMSLTYDFDRLNDPGGLPNVDPFNVLYQNANAGLGAAEAIQAPGDSGGPAFVGANVIAGVLATRSRRGTPPDIDGVENSSFGEVGTVTSVSATIGDPALQGVLNPGGGKKYDLVLDMNQQVYGRSNLVGGGADTIEITAQNVGGFLEIYVSGTGLSADANLSGLYYRAPVANIKSLTIRGTSDNETFKIIGDLDISGAVSIEGGTGVDEVIYDDSAVAAADERHYTFSNVPAGWDTQLNRAVISGGVNSPLQGILSKTIAKFSLITSPGNDVVRVEELSATMTGGLFVTTGTGTDVVHIGVQTGYGPGGMSNVNAPVYVNGGATADTLYFQDDGAAAIGHNYTFSDKQAGWDARLNRAVSNGQGGMTNLTPVDAVAVSQYVLNTSPGVDIIKVEETPAAGSAAVGITINAGAMNDTITVGSQVYNGLDRIQKPVTVDGGTGENTLIVDNRAAAIVKNLTVTKTAVTRADGKTVNYANVKKPQVETDGGGANVNVVEKQAGVELKVDFQNGGNVAAFGAGVFEYQAGVANTATVTGAGNQVTLAGLLGLTVLPGLVAPAGTVFTLLDNQTDAPIVGIFNGLNEGAI
jgi:hypothetical protein